MFFLTSLQFKWGRICCSLADDCLMFLHFNSHWTTSCVFRLLVSRLILYMVKISVWENVPLDVQLSRDEKVNVCRKNVKDQSAVGHFSSFSHSMCCIRNCTWNVLYVTLVLQRGTHVAISHLYCNSVTICDFSLCQSSLIKVKVSDTNMRARTVQCISYMLFSAGWHQGKF